MPLSYHKRQRNYSQNNCNKLQKKRKVASLLANHKIIIIALIVSSN